jgi:flagellar motor switch/type III secretory pathway protein FliN
MPDATTPNPSSSNRGETVPPSGAVLLVQSATHNDANAAARSDLVPISEESPLAGLPMQLDVTIPIPGFRVQDLLALEKGAILESRWPHAEDVPVWCGGVQLVWTEFEVVEQKLAVRVTRLR